MNKKRIFVLAGPTGSGKSALAVQLAQEIDAEIVSADAFQVYRGLAVLTAQPTPEQLVAVRHHLTGFLPPEEEFSAVDFARLAREAIEELQARGKIALVVGGAGFYLRALFGGATAAPPPAPGLREELAGLSPETLLQRLEEADPAASRQVDRQNPRRVQRALEIVLTTGRPFASFAPQPADFPPGLVLDAARGWLHTRIEERAAALWREGAVGEVAALGKISATCAQIIGLWEMQRYLRGEMTRKECLASIQSATRQYAKRQLTWFRNQTDWPAVSPAEAREMALEELGF